MFYHLHCYFRTCVSRGFKVINNVICITDKQKYVKENRKKKLGKKIL